MPHAEEEADAPSVQYLGRADDLHCRGVTTSARAWKAIGGERLQARAELEPSPSRTGHVWSFAPHRLSEGKGSTGSQLDATATWATRRLEEAVAGSVHVEGQSNIAALSAGATFELDGHPHTDLDQAYAVLSVVHQADVPEAEVGHVEGSGPTYTNRFVAAPLGAGPVRPPLPSKPRAAGMESATVVGPEGEEVHTDALGRVQVRFVWDDAPSQTCWLRVMSAWAGAGYGASFIPRVGMDVVVSFLGGDPDRPVVVGCLYTGTNVPPGALPQSKTCTTLRTQSSPSVDDDSPGYNELRFEDARGREEVYLHAQRNQTTVVRAAQSTRVGASRNVTVGAESNRSVGGSETVTIGAANEDGHGEPGDLDVRVTGCVRTTVEQDDELTVLKNALWRVEEALIVNAQVGARFSCDDTGASVTLEPKSVRIEALESIRFEVGPASLELTPRGVFIEGPVFTANASEQIWLSSDAGNLGLTQDQAGLYGGSRSESKVELRASGAWVEAPRINLEGEALVSIEAETARVSGSENATLTSKGSAGVTARSILIHADKATDIKGEPINLN